MNGEELLTTLALQLSLIFCASPSEFSPLTVLHLNEVQNFT
jgi:hypothetical protein